MENPATWGQAEKVVNAAIANHDYLDRTIPGLCGLSLARQITDALRGAGLLKEEEVSEPPCERDDSAEAHNADAAVLHEAAAILRSRFRTGKHDGTAAAVRQAEIELISRGRHPSRQV